MYQLSSLHNNSAISELILINCTSLKRVRDVPFYTETFFFLNVKEISLAMTD